MSKIRISRDVHRPGGLNGTFVASEGDELEVGNGDGQVSRKYADRLVGLKLAENLAPEPVEKPKSKKALSKEADLAAKALLEAGEGAQAAKELLEEVALAARNIDKLSKEDENSLTLAKASVEEADEAVAAAKLAHEAAEAALAAR